jgi:glycosyltransferase involved in cell wall biosynthesis
MTIRRPFLLDCTRAVARHLAGHQPSGIDRVCDAYVSHFADTAQAVLQFRGKARILSLEHSRRLFAMLQQPVDGFRRRFVRFAPAAYASGSAEVAARGRVYLNVSHTDFDLPAHHRWVRQCGFKSVYLLHDLIPILHPQWTTSHRASRHYERVLAALRSASGIVVNSRVTAQHLEQFADEQGVVAPPLLSAPLAATDLPLNPTSQDTGSADALVRQLAGHPYFVCVATIEARKNHLMLLKAWRRLIASEGAMAPHLLLIGRWGVHSARVRRYLDEHRELSGRVTVHDNCSDAEIDRALAGARALLAPSQAEGFGLPVAEALKLGVPVVASNLPAFLEIGAGIPLFLDPGDEAGWLSAVRAFTGDSALRRTQMVKLSHYNAPSWNDHFTLLDPWIEQLRRAPKVPKLPLRQEPPNSVTSDESAATARAA